MRKHRVLIADASPTFRAYLRGEFDPERFQVFEAATGLEAIRVAFDIRPTIATLSLMLPECDGIEVCSAITSNDATAETTVIMATSRDSEDGRLRAFEAGAVRFLNKNFSKGELGTYVEQIVQRRNQLAGARALVVDDNKFIRSTVANLLRCEGATSYQAGNGKEALEVLDKHDVDVVLTDYHMPVMDGIAFVRALRDRPEHESTPVLLLSASEYRSTTVRALDAGANDFIRKPFEATELLARLRSFCRLARLAKELETLAVTDELTGLWNRREAMLRLADLCARANRHQATFSCILVDIDQFKGVNDRYGHAAGDAVLRSVARTMADCVRDVDKVCRVGGEEFLVVCPDTSAHDAQGLAERLRAAVESQVIAYESHTIGATISLGVAEFCSSMVDSDGILSVADEALYAAKNAGRNTVRLPCACESTHFGSQREPAPLKQT